MSKEKQYTPYEAAIDFIKPYVLRGDTAERLMDSQMGTASDRYYAQIGGGMYRNYGKPDQQFRKLKRDEVGVSEVNRQPCLEVFPLRRLVQDIKDAETGTPVVRQLSLFE